MSNLWQEALLGVRPRVDAQTFDIWLRPIELLSHEEDTLKLRAPSRFLKDWFENHYLSLVMEEIVRQHGRAYRVEIDVVSEPEDDQKAHAEQVARSKERRKRKTAATAEAASVVGPAKVPAASSPTATSAALARAGLPPEGLQPRYKFNTFIRGASNELALSAGLAAAENPGTRFNPLFIYGGCGLGKTHLLQAIGHDIHRRFPQARICYISAERFMNEFVSSVRHNSFDAFRERYREGCDCLLIDDIQFIAGKDRTMDEFFHVFNALYEAGKQIVVTADRCPREMEGMESRLISRLKWGLVADIQAPDLETRLAIVEQLCERERVEIPRSAKVLLAEYVRHNVRELEGALVRLLALAELKNVAITDLLVREIFGPKTVQEGGQVTVDSILKAVSSYYSVKVSELKGSRRHRSIARPRMLAMYLSRELTGASYPEIGHRFGGKDHTTVMNACKRITQLCADDSELLGALQSLTSQLGSRVA